jgi:alpha-ketoglutarate-dependent 2,4-dichlorophenoxyacetate dioxygenase
MSISIKELTPGFMGEVSGVDITQPLTSAQAAELEAGMDRYGVLVYHDQRFTDDQQKAFSTYFGPLENTSTGSVITPAGRRLDAFMADVSNLGVDHKPLARDDRRRLFNLGNQLWHSDSSYKAVPSKYSLLSGRIVVDAGGNTEFADMRAAYDALDDRTKAEIEDLVCRHSNMYSRGKLGLAEFSDEERAVFRPVRQRLVRPHPVSGRKSLFLSAHAGEIEGMPLPHARMLLLDLTEFATRERFVYSHVWRVNDLVMWDNRSTMHRGRRFDPSEPRDIRQTRLSGDGPTIAQDPG